MLTVKTPEEAMEIVLDLFPAKETPAESIALRQTLGRVLSCDIVADEYVPCFDRSTVDGYAVIAADTFGSSESIPSMLTLTGEVLMGEAAVGKLNPGTCAAVSTGGDLPECSDAVVMLEHVGIYGDGVIDVYMPAAPGNNIIFKGDDVKPGDKVLAIGTVISPHDIGILSALGHTAVSVKARPIVGVISTGDELVEPEARPGRGQIRDVNTPMLSTAMERFGAVAKSYGIIRDDEKALSSVISKAVSECDIVLISGGSSAGMRDLTARIIESVGEIIFHGIAMKPGKPTILGVIDSKPIFGLPGNPVAAYFVTELFVRPLIARMMQAEVRQHMVNARISEAVSANHGRAEYIAVKYDIHKGTAHPIKGKSGLIASLAGTDGYICIPRDSEGIPAGAEVTVKLF